MKKKTGDKIAGATKNKPPALPKTVPPFPSIFIVTPRT
jgi:hypothetical protein